MKNLKKLMVLSVAALSLTACGGSPAASSEPAPSSEPESSQPAPSSEESSSQYVPPVKPTTYVPGEDEDVYESVLGHFNEVYQDALRTNDNDLRYVKLAKAEAELMDAGLMAITYSNGGNYALTRVAPRTIPFALFGNDDDRLEGTVIVKKNADNTFIPAEDRAAMIEQWKSGEYDPKAYLTAKGYEFDDTYRSAFSTLPETLDPLATSKQATTESLVNGIEGLYKIDNFGVRQPCIATGDPEISVDNKTYTFTLRDDVYWYNADKQQVGKLTASDFVAGFEHMLDVAEGLHELVLGLVKGAEEYVAQSGDEAFFAENVGVRAIDDTHLEIELEKPESYFITRLTYSCFMPMCKSFYISKGGVFGVDEFKEASQGDNYKYALVTDLSSMAFNGAYLPVEITDNSVIKYEANPNYRNYANITTKKLQWEFDDGKNPTESYNKAVAGTRLGLGLSEANGTLKLAQDDGNFEKYAYVTDTDSTTFFGGYNINRRTFEKGSVVSTKTEQEKIDFQYAMSFKSFRKALQHGWDRHTWNASTVGEVLADVSLRNIYTAPGFVALGGDVEFEGHTFTAGSNYGSLVQYFLEKDWGEVVNCEDGQDGWYNPELALQYFAQAKEEMGENWAPVKIDLAYYANSASQTTMANAYKQLIEGLFTINGEKNIIVNLTPASTVADYYAIGYLAEDGADACYDIFYGSGWGPDWGDPTTYVGTFAGDGAGYMCKVIGLY